MNGMKRTVRPFVKRVKLSNLNFHRTISTENPGIGQYIYTEICIHLIGGIMDCEFFNIKKECLYLCPSFPFREKEHFETILQPNCLN